jgi:hypothetical protein
MISVYTSLQLLERVVGVEDFFWFGFMSLPCSSWLAGDA